MIENTVAHVRHATAWHFKKVIRLYKRTPWRRPRPLPLREELRDAREWRKFTRGAPVAR